MIKIAGTAEIEIAIARLFGIRRNIIAPNISWGLNIHECDMLIIRESGYAVEVEIKRSKQDLKNDFLKRHQHSTNKTKEFYYAIPDEYYDDWKHLIFNSTQVCGIITYRYTSGLIVAQIKDRAPTKKNCRKLSQVEMLKAAKLGCMRIWDLKQVLFNKGI
jgi:hypothetical protein